VRLLLATLAAAGAVLGGILASASGAETAPRARATAMIAAGDVGPQNEVAVTGARTERRTGAVAHDLLTVRSGESIAKGSLSGLEAAARAVAVARSVSILGGRVTAYGVRRETTDAASGTIYSGRVNGLAVDGRVIGDVTDEQRYDLQGGGTVVVNRDGIGIAVELPDGTDIRIAVVRATARQGAPAATPTATPTPEADDSKAKPKRKRTNRAPARLSRGGFAFPVFSPEATVADDYLGPRQIGPHQGNDVFAPFGSPVLAVADGRLRKVGTLPISGNRLWLITDRGDAFFYAHLSAFAPTAETGRRVKAGEVLGFVGNTGDAEPTPPHLHFEIHPRDLDKPAVNPHKVLLAWQERQDVAPGAWLKRVGADTGERPGALVEVRDFIAGE
jgi:murein DD-endopeptidase MepM/ murein hydrolase activator NlpD